MRHLGNICNSGNDSVQELQAEFLNKRTTGSLDMPRPVRTPGRSIFPKRYGSKGCGCSRPICRTSQGRCSVRLVQAREWVNKQPQEGTEASARGRWSPRCTPGARPRRAALQGRGSCGDGGAETEAFPVGERSEAPQEVPGERLLCAPCSSADLPPAPRHPPRPALQPRLLSQLLSGAPHVRPRHSGHSARSQPNPSSLPPRRHTGWPCRPQPAGCWETWGRIRWQLGETPRPPSQARPPLLFSLLGTSYRRFSEELRPAPGLDGQSRCGGAWGSGKGQVGESSGGGRVRKSGGRELSGFVYLGGQSSWPLPPLWGTCSHLRLRITGGLAERRSWRSLGGGMRKPSLWRAAAPYRLGGKLPRQSGLIKDLSRARFASLVPKVVKGSFETFHIWVIVDNLISFG